MVEEKKEKPKEPKKPEKIEVDKDFLMKVLKVVEDLKGEVTLMKQGGFKSETSPAKGVSPERDYIFQSAFVISMTKIPVTPEEAQLYKQRSIEFQKKLEKLMKEHKIIQATAMFLKKL